MVLPGGLLGWMRRYLRWTVAAAVLAACGAALAVDELGTGAQLESVRAEIRRLETRLAELESQRRDAASERQRLDTQLQLAEARVRELELVTAGTGEEISRLRVEVASLAEQLERRRTVLARHLEMVALLGQPGPIQLFWDAVQGGDLDRAVGTVVALTDAQTRLMREYDRLQAERTARLADLSRALEAAERENQALAARRRELESVRRQVIATLNRVERSQRQTSSRLADLRQREEALERLLEVVGSRQRFTGHEDITPFRGALPWPADGTLVRRFGRHALPDYSAYTVCNGLRLNPPGGSAVSSVFPGVVAFARYFKGYGNMVVVDHGRDVFSLVAGLATIHVRVDQSVVMGTRLGLAAPPSDEGSLYVEIRVGGKPQDPLRWFQLKGESS